MPNVLKILSHCNFLRESVTWEPLFHFPDEETEGEKAEGKLPKAEPDGTLHA